MARHRIAGKKATKAHLSKKKGGRKRHSKKSVVKA